MTASTSVPRFCIVSDLDHTMVDHHDPEFKSLLEFNRVWVSKFAHDSQLVFSTGRSLVMYKKLRTEAPMLTPDLLICSVGTEIYHTTETGLELDQEWLQKLDEGWDRSKILQIVKDKCSAMKPQSETEQRPHKVSYHLQQGLDAKTAADIVSQLRRDLEAAGLKVKVVHSGGIDVDVLPHCASKGLALQFLQARWKGQGLLPTEGIQVNGDSGNDAELYEVPDVYGCVVGNAMQELLDLTAAIESDRIFRATETCAAGILQTMRHFDKVLDDSALPPAARVRQLLVNLCTFRAEWRRGTVSNDSALVDQQLGARLAPDFKMVDADGAVYTKATFVSQAAAERSAAPKPSNGQASYRSWLDRVSAVECGDAWFVTYDLWQQDPGQAQTGPVYHSAVVAADADAPEGFVVKHLQGTSRKADP